MSSVDRDLERIEAQQEEQLQDKVLKIASLVPKGPADKEICECGTDIPAQRMAAGYTNCVVCQSVIELKNKHFAARR